MSEAGPPAVGVAADNLWKLSRLEMVLARTRLARVPVIVLKGAALLEWLYDLHERPMADVDLLIHPPDRDRFLQALAPEGRFVDTTVPRGLVPNYRSGQFAVSFLGLSLDVHVHLLNRPWLRDLAPFAETGLWDRAVPATIARQATLRLSTEDQLLHLSAHAVFHHHIEWDADRSHPVEDVRRILERCSVDWAALYDLAASQRLRTALWVMLAEPSLSGLVPSNVLSALRPSKGGMRRIALAGALARAGDRSFAPVLLTEDPAGVARAAATILTPSRDWLAARYPRVPATPIRAVWHSLRLIGYVAVKILALARHRLARPAA